MIKNESKKIFFSATQSPQLIYLSQNQHMRDNSQPRLVDNNPVNFSVHRPNHRRFRSCESPLDQVVLMVKKERLKNKGKVDGPLILKERKFRIKQKTDCHNQEYLDFLKRKKAVVNWVKFNITEGIYLLSNRVNNIMSIDKIKKNSQIETLEQKVQQLNQLAKQLNKAYIESEKTEDSIKKQEEIKKEQQNVQHFIVKHTFERSKQISRNNRMQKLKNKNISFQNYGSKYGKQSLQSQKQPHPINDKQVSKILEMIRSCNKDINQLNVSLINASIENISHSKTKENIQSVKQLKDKLHSNQCTIKLIDDFVTKLECLQNSQGNISMTMQQLKTMEQLMITQLQNSLSQHPKGSNLSSSMLNNIPTALSGLSKPSIKPSALSKKGLSRKNMASCKNNSTKNQQKRVRIAPNNNSKARASIQLRIDSGTMLNNFCSSNIATPKQVSILKMKSKNLVASAKKNVGLNSSNNISMSSQSEQDTNIRKKKLSKHSKQSEQSKKNKKSLAFDLKFQDNNKKQNKKLSKKNILKSIHRSRKQISNTSISCASFRSVRNITTLRHIGTKKNLSNSSSTDLKQFHSFRNKRQVQFIKGKLKKISLVRNYKSIMFKFISEMLGERAQQSAQMKKQQILKILKGQPEQQHEEPQQQTVSEINVHSIEQKIILNDNEISKQKQQKTLPSSVLSQTPPFLPTQLQQKTKGGQYSIRKQNRVKCIQEHPDEKNNVIRQFMVKLRAVQYEENISKKKELLNNNIEKLMESKLISQQNYLKFKQIMQRTKKRKCKVEQEVQQQREESKKNFESPYHCLLDLNKMIASNDKLSQTNYYYQFNQFKLQQQMNMIKLNHLDRDDQFFNIRTSLEHKKSVNKEKIQLTFQKCRDRLLQKDF